MASGTVKGPCPKFKKETECYSGSDNHDQQFVYQWQLLRYRMDCQWKDDFWVKTLKSRWHLPPKGSFTDFGGYCCSQFVVTREAIHQYPKRFYESLLKRLSNTQPWDHASRKTLGRTMDFLWHTIFTGERIEPRYSPSAFTVS